MYSVSLLCEYYAEDSRSFLCKYTFHTLIAWLREIDTEGDSICNDQGTQVCEFPAVLPDCFHTRRGGQGDAVLHLSRQ